MATKTWYATNNLASVHQELSETDPGTETYASPVTGWVIGSSITSIYGLFNSQVEQTTFTNTAGPNGTPDTTNGDCLRTTNPYTGDFASGNWELHFCVRANTNASGQRLIIRFILLRGANADGSGATAIGGVRAANVTPTGGLLTTATHESSLTFNPGAFSVSNEYIFVQILCEKTSVGSMSTADANMRIGNASGNGTRLISADFTDTTPYPYFIGAGASSSAVGAAVTPALPAGWAENDIFLLFAQGSNETIPTPSGWTLIDSASHLSTGTAQAAGSLRLGVFWRRATSSESSPSVSAGLDHTIAQILCFRNCDQSGDPYNTVGTGFYGTATASHGWSTYLGPNQWVDGVQQTSGTPDFYTLVDNQYVVAVICHAVDSASAQSTTTGGQNMSGYAELSGCDVSTTSGTGGGFAISGGTAFTAANVGTSTNHLHFALATASKAAFMVLGLIGPSQAKKLTVTQGSFALVGQAVGLMWGQRSVVLPPGSYALTGQDLAFAKGRQMPLVQGSYVFTGQPTGVNWNQRVIGIPHGIFTLTGQTVILKRGLLFALVQGSYTTVGQAVNLLRGRTIAIVQGLYTLTGFATNFLRPRIMLLVQGSYALTGQDVTLTKVLSRTLAVVQGAYTFSGQAVNLLRGRWLIAVQGTYSLAGQVTNLLRSRIATSVSEVYTLTGQVVNLLRGRRLITVQGVYSLAGQIVILVRPRILGVTTGFYAVTGQIVNVLQGKRMVLVQGLYNLAGQVVNFLRPIRILAVTQGAYALTGIAVNLFKTTVGAFIMPVSRGTYTFSGQTVNLLRGNKVGLVQGVYSLAGQATNLLRGRRVVIVQGAYAVAGQIVILLRPRIITLVRGLYSLVGQAQNLLRGRRVVAVQGAYALTGQPTTNLRRSRLMPVAFGAYGLAGEPVILTYQAVGHFVLGVVQGSYVLAGQPVTFRRTVRMPLVQGGYTMSGQPTTLSRGRMVPLVQGVYAVTGFAQNFRFGRTVSLLQGDYIFAGFPIIISKTSAPRYLTMTPGIYVVTGEDMLFWQGGFSVVKAGQKAGSTLRGMRTGSGFRIVPVSDSVVRVAMTETIE